MWDYIKRFLGVNTPTDNYASRFEDRREPCVSSNWEHNFDDLSDDESFTAPNQHFFSVFTNPIEMHKFFERQMEEIVKRAFQFNKEIGWDDGFLSEANEERPQPSGNLRDEFLKPGITDKMGKDDDLDGHIGAQEFQSFLDGPKSPQRPSTFSRSIIVQTVRHPDGTVETTRTERDHTGRETTTTTTTTGGNSLIQDRLPITVNDIFSKLISF